MKAKTQLIKQPLQMQKKCLSIKRQGKHIAFVPTMGYLHAGHLQLVKEAKKRADTVIVSIFVNPLQFAQNEDLSRYPTDIAGDLAKLKSMGVDCVFLPTPQTLYPQGFQTHVEVEVMTQAWCGLSRPGHFRGVTTVVLKLLQIVQPDIAVFGKKDYQQYLVIKKMVADLNIPVKIIGVATQREKDGLAMSSRNSYLSADERRVAPMIYQALQAVKKSCQNQTLSQQQMQLLFKKHLVHDSRLRVDYIEARDAYSLQHLAHYQSGRTVLATAVFLGKTRLIDNLVF